MNKKFVHLRRIGATLEMTLDRPKANAINRQVSQELGAAFDTFQADDSLRVAIVKGGGEKFFSAGWDLKAEEAVDAYHGPGGFAGLTERFHLNKPVIAAVNGLAVGGGFELALACDLIVAVDYAEFFLPETKRGIIPDAGGILRLPKSLPHAVASELLLTGRRMSADEAYRFGLVNAVVKYSELMKTAHRLAEEIGEGAPLAVAAVKEVLHHTEHMSIEAGYRMMRSGQLKVYEQMLASTDAVEGPRAFAEKRQPVWKGK